MLNPETTFRDVKAKHGGGWMAKCPAHDDSTASLSIDHGKNGGWVLKCFAGCDNPKIVAAVGRTMADLQPDRPATEKPKKTATYTYCDERGTPLYHAHRYEPKGFKQQSADGSWKMNGVRRVAYHLDKLQGETTAYIPEGEKDADRLWLLGLTATCNVGGAGAGKWKSDYTDQLKAAGVQRVVVLPDNDESGYAHADEIARSCHAAGLAVKYVVLPDLQPKGDVSDWLDAGHTKDDLVKLVKATPLYTPSAASIVTSEAITDDDMDADDEPEPATKKKSQATELIDLADECGVTLWHTASGDAYGTITVADHHEHHRVSRVVREYLAGEYYRRYSRAATASALNDAAGTLSARAKIDGDEHPIAVRLGAHNDTLYLDLGDPEWRAVAIDANGWRIVTNPPVRHTRPPSLRPLPAPIQGGSLDALRELWPAINDETWYLSASWLVAALAPRGPYPVLVETGEQGSGKSTYGRMLRGLIDPASPELRGVPRNEHDVMIGAVKSYVVALDNLSGLQPWLSDALCRIATGGGLATRTLYSDLDETLIDVTRPILLTGIDSPATRGDLLDRALVVTLPAMCDNDRGEEVDLWARYHAMRPALLGALLDAASCALSRRATIKLKAKPRMADACTWVTAAEPALGWRDGLTVQTWMGARSTASADLLASDPIGVAITDMALPWEGTTGELLDRLSASVSERVRSARTWPTSAKGLSVCLRRLAPELRRSGIDVSEPKASGHSRKRVFSIVRTVRTQSDPADTGRESARSTADGHADDSPGVNGQSSATVRTANAQSSDFGLFRVGADDAYDADDSSHTLSTGSTDGVDEAEPVAPALSSPVGGGRARY